MKTIVWFGLVLGALSATGNVILTKPGQSVTFECEVKDDRNNQVWRHGDNLIFNIIGKTGVKTKGTTDTARRAVERNKKLSISGVKEEDAGEFSCETEGHYQKHTLVVYSVSLSVVPSAELQPGDNATLQCQLKGLNPEPTVQWRRPNGKLHTGSELRSVDHSDAGIWACTFKYNKELYSENLIIKVTDPVHMLPKPVHPQNPTADHKATCPNCPSKPPSNDDLLLGLSWWMWVLVGVGCLIVVLLMVLVICLCKMIKRKKRKLQKMRNSHQLLTPRRYCQCDCTTAAAKSQQGRWREKPSAPPLQPFLME